MKGSKAKTTNEKIKAGPVLFIEKIFISFPYIYALIIRKY
jgi:hypothetical protein